MRVSLIRRSSCCLFNWMTMGHTSLPRRHAPVFSLFLFALSISFSDFFFLSLSLDEQHAKTNKWEPSPEEAHGTVDGNTLSPSWWFNVSKGQIKIHCLLGINNHFSIFVTLCPTFSPQLTYPFRKKKKFFSLIAHGIFDLPCLFFRFSHLFFSLVPGVHLNVCRNALPLG